MARILAVTWDGGGNVPPLLALAREAARRGHAVRVLGHPAQRETIEAAGLSFVPFQHARPWSPRTPRSGLRFAVAYLGLFTDPGPGQDVRDELAAGVDLVLVDAMMLSALRAALSAGRPTVALAHTFYRYLAARWARGPIGWAAATRGLRPRRLWGAADRVLVASDRTLDAPSDPPPTVRHTGLIEAPAQRGDRVGGDATVLVSLSTIDYPGQTATLQAVLVALADLPVRVVVTTGPAVDPAALRTASRVEVMPYVPHEQLMPRASLLIGHGGHSTTLRALAHDLPVLLLPLHPQLDQPMIAAAVAAAGAGRVLPPTAPPESIRQAAQELLAEGPHRIAAAAIGERLRAQGGLAAAVDELDAVLAERLGARRREAPRLAGEAAGVPERETPPHGSPATG